MVGVIGRARKEKSGTIGRLNRNVRVSRCVAMLCCDRLYIAGWTAFYFQLMVFAWVSEKVTGLVNGLAEKKQYRSLTFLEPSNICGKSLRVSLTGEPGYVVFG